MTKKDISQKALQLYLKEIERYSVALTPKEEKELAKRIEKGDEEAKKKLTRANLMLVVKIAKYYARRSRKFTMFDLIPDGNLGLNQAADLYNWRRGYKFSALAVLTIGLAIRSALEGKGKALPILAVLLTGLEKIKRKKELFIQPKIIDYPHDYLSANKKMGRKKYTREEKAAWISKIKDYIRENTSEAIELLSVIGMFSKIKAKEEIKKI